MRIHQALAIALATMVLGGSAGLRYAHSQNSEGTLSVTVEPKLVLTAVQRSAIYRAVSIAKNKKAPVEFPAMVGADVPPMIELYALPDDAVSGNSAAKFFEYTVVQDQVVLVDPTKMRVIDVIGPPPRQ